MCFDWIFVSHSAPYATIFSSEEDEDVEVTFSSEEDVDVEVTTTTTPLKALILLVLASLFALLASNLMMITNQRSNPSRVALLS